MSNVKTLRPQGNPSPEQTVYEYFNDPLDRTEAERATWVDYRIHVGKFKADRTLESEIKAVAARDAWHAAWRAVNVNADRGAA